VGRAEQQLPHLLAGRDLEVDAAGTLRPGVNVMVTIFLRFLPIFGEKIAVFLKNQCYDQNFA
jgi:hypothetical protein